jgi:hypothetical protein
MTPEQIIAHILGGGLYGFGGRVSASARLKIAEGIISALKAGGFKVVRSGDGEVADR